MTGLSMFSVAAAANQTITFPSVSKTYGDADFSPATASSGLPVYYASNNPAVAVIIDGGTKIRIVGAGSVTITASQPGNAGFNAAPNVSRTFTVAKAPLSVRPNDCTREYGDPNPVFSLTYTGFVNGDDVSVLDVIPTATTAANLGTAAGNHNITASGGSDNNYVFSYVTGILTITKAIVIITAEDKSRIYGNSNPTFSLAYSGLKNGDTNSKINTKPSSTTTATSSSPVGDYPIVLSGGSSTSYSLVLVNGTLTVTKAPLTVTADNKSKTYGDDNPALTFKYSSFKNSENASVLTEVPVISTAAGKSSDAGTYPIVLSGGQAQNYYFVYNNGVFTINKKSLRVTAENKSRQYATPNPALTYVYSGFVLGQNSSVLAEEPSISTTAVLSSPAGTYPITLSGGISHNYSFNLVAGTLTVTKAPQTITFPEMPDIPFGSPDFDPASASSGLPITYLSSNPNIIKVVNGKLHLTGVGQVLITAYQYGDNNYQSVDVQRWITVGKSNQTVSFAGNIVKTFNDPEFHPGAVASSGLPVTYTIANSGIAVPSFGGVKITGAGITTITAIQAGNDSYNAASATVTLTVNRASQNITFPEIADKDFGYPDFDPGAVSSAHLAVVYESDNPAVAVVVNNMIRITGTGTATITASQPGTTNYQAAPGVSKTLTVLKAPQTITFGMIQSRMFNDPDFSPGAVASSGLPVSYSSSNPAVATIVAGKIRITGVGSTTITATQEGNTNYQAAGSVSQVFQVSKAAQQIVFSSIPEKAIDQPDFTLSASATSGLPVVYSIDNPSIATVSPGGAVKILSTGTATITVKQEGNAFFHPAADAKQTLIVKNSSQTITFGSIPEKTFGNADFTISATSSSGLPVSFFSDNTQVAVIDQNTVKITGAGVANIFALQSGDSHYAAATPVSREFVVNKTTQTITFPPLPQRAYGDGAFIPWATASSGLKVEFTSSNPAVALVMDGKIYITGTGAATITAVQSGSRNYLAASPVSQLFNVVKAQQTISFEAIPVKKYGDPDFFLNATATSGLPVEFTSSNPSVITIVNNRVKITGTGTSTITASQPGDMNNLPASSKIQVLTVEKASQSIDFPALQPVKFGTAPFMLNATASSGLPVTFSSSNPDIAAISNGMVQVFKTGMVTITATQQGNQNYHPAVPAVQNLTISKQTQILVFDSIAPKKYGDPDFNAGAIASSGLPVTIEIDNPQVARVVNGKIRITGAGRTHITARQDGNQSYLPAADPITRVLVVDKAIVTVTPVKASRNYLENDPPFYATYAGFVNGENQDVIDILPAIRSNANELSYPGIYELTASGAMDGNYDFVYQKGILLVLGTKPLKPGKPEGNSRLCINPGKQEYRTPGAVFASSYMWSIHPASAGQITGNGKNIVVQYNENFSGRAAIAVKAANNQGISETSDTLFTDVLKLPERPEIAYRGKYCSVNNTGDSLRILNSQSLYQYQLLRNGAVYQDIITGNGKKIGWGNLMAGTYTLAEKTCNITLRENITISEVDPSSTRPVLEVKWNDVVICRNNGDSIEEYTWLKNGEPIAGQKNQYLWTQKQEGYYAVKTIDITGCVFMSDSVWISSQPAGTIYPNPNNGNFRLTFTNDYKGKTTVRISSVNSAVVKVFDFNKKDEILETDISIPGLKTGIYFLELIQDGKRVYYEKFVRE